MEENYWAKTTEDESRTECFSFCLAGVRPLEAAHGHPNSSWHPTLRLLQLHSFLWWIYNLSLDFLASSPATLTLKLSIFLWNYESNSPHIGLSVVLSYCVGLVHRQSKSPLLNGLVKIEATVYWARYGGVNVRGVFMRDVWPGVKLGKRTWQYQEPRGMAGTESTSHHRDESPFFILKDVSVQDFRNYRKPIKFKLALKSYSGWKASASV